MAKKRDPSRLALSNIVNAPTLAILDSRKIQPGELGAADLAAILESPLGKLCARLADGLGKTLVDGVLQREKGGSPYMVFTLR